jgi:hypothetical protein
VEDVIKWRPRRDRGDILLLEKGRVQFKGGVLKSCRSWPRIALDRGSRVTPCLGQVMHRLQIEPEFRARAEEASQPESGVGSHRQIVESGDGRWANRSGLAASNPMDYNPECL